MQILTRYSFLALFLIALPMSACDNADPDPDPDPTPQIGGTYTGSYFDTDSGQSIDYEFVIPNTSGGSFSFTGEVSAEEGGITVSANFTGSGSYDHPDVAMTITYDGESESSNGTVSPSGDIITLRDSNGDTVTLTRQ